MADGRVAVTVMAEWQSDGRVAVSGSQMAE